MKYLGRLAVCLAVALLFATTACAAVVNWNGNDWDNDTYGNVLEVVNGDLIVHELDVPDGGGYYLGEAHCTTDTAFRALATPSVEYSYVESDFELWINHGPGGALTVEGPGMKASIQAPPGAPNYQVWEQVGEGGWTSYQPQTIYGGPMYRGPLGLHTLKIAKRVDGKIDYIVDDRVIRTSTAQGPEYFSDVRLISFSNPTAAPGTAGPVNTTFSTTHRPNLWKGQRWNTLDWGNDMQIVFGNLVVGETGPRWGSYFHGSAHYQTDDAFRAGTTPWVQTTWIDEHFMGDPDWVANPGATMEIFGPNLSWRARIEGIPGQWAYTVTENFSGGPWNTYWVGPSRTAEPHTFKIAKRSDGKLDYFVDGILCRTSTAVFPGAITEVDLYNYSNSSAFPGTLSPVSVAFTDFQSGAESSKPVTVDGAKKELDGTVVKVSDVVVTKAWTDYFYVESSDRFSGIRVNYAGHGYSSGDSVTIEGPVSTGDNDERYIDAVTITKGPAGSVDPLGMTNRSLGGGDFGDVAGGKGQKGITDASGLNNVGMLIRTTGKVTPAGSLRYSLDDGSGVNVLVEVPSGVSLQDGNYYVITGIVSCEKSTEGVILRLILVENSNDIQPVTSP